MADKDSTPINTYEDLCSYENLETAFNKARKGKTQKPYVTEFEENLKENLLQLRTELHLQTYRPQPLKTFILRDPKTRKISKSAFRDRIIHHAICNIIEPSFDKRFIHDSFANRLGKGTLNAIKRFDTFKKKASKNSSAPCYVLKADIKSYFDTVNHQILLRILGKRIKDERLMRLIRKILANHKGGHEGKGMPLGNLTSQFFANVYLDELDQFVKHKLRAKYYIRYVDDFAILHQSKTAVKDYKHKIDSFLRAQLDLKLHSDKSQVLTLDNGISFLGFKIFYNHKTLAKRNMRKFEKKLEQMKRLYWGAKIDREKVIEKLEGWLAYASHANTHKYRRRMTSRFNASFPAQQYTKINSAKKHENFNRKIDESKIEFSQQKTLRLIKLGMTAKQIAKARGIKEGTAWDHTAKLVENHQLTLKSILPNYKIKTVLANIKSQNDTLKEIKSRINDESISYNEINCVLANIKGKHKKKSITYFIDWYKRTNCFRKCYLNKNQRQECRVKLQQFAAKSAETQFTKNEFLKLFNNHTSICTLPDKEKRRPVSWREFKVPLRKNPKKA